MNAEAIRSDVFLIVSFDGASFSPAAFLTAAFQLVGISRCTRARRRRRGSRAPAHAEATRGLTANSSATARRRASSRQDRRAAGRRRGAVGRQQRRRDLRRRSHALRPWDRKQASPEPAPARSGRWLRRPTIPGSTVSGRALRRFHPFMRKMPESARHSGTTWRMAGSTTGGIPLHLGIAAKLAARLIVLATGSTTANPI